MKHVILAALMTLGLASAAQACGENLEITDAWVRPTMEGKDMTAAFFKVKNNGGEAHKLTSVSLQDAIGEIHTTVEENGVFRMRHALEVEIPAGETVEFRPGSFHIMLMKQKQPLKEGDTATMTLHCENGRSVTTTMPVKSRP